MLKNKKNNDGEKSQNKTINSRISIRTKVQDKH